MTTRVAVLGATGTIGDYALAVLFEQKAYTVWLCAAEQNHAKMAAICATHNPAHAVLTNKGAARILHTTITGTDTVVHDETDTLLDLVAHPDCDIVIAGIAGFAGLHTVWAAVCAGKTILLANKESFIVAGKLLLEKAHATGAKIIPIDSEHNGIYQCVPGCVVGAHLRDKAVDKIVLTASGGPFLHADDNTLHTATPESACRNPNWQMGNKISVDSATLMNKGLEIIEACRLFNIDETHIDVVVHPQSIVHALVYFCDGSVIACLSEPDMRIPIAHALAVARNTQHPQRLHRQYTSLDLTQHMTLTFLPPDTERFPALTLARRACTTGGSMPTVLNAANEVAVKAFLARRIAFLDIMTVVHATCHAVACETIDSIADVVTADMRARTYAHEQIRQAA